MTSQWKLAHNSQLTFAVYAIDIHACTYVESVTSYQKSWLRQSIHIYLKNNRARFHPDLIWNDGSLGLLKRSPSKNKNKMRSDFPDPKPGIGLWSRVGGVWPRGCKLLGQLTGRGQMTGGAVCWCPVTYETPSPRRVLTLLKEERYWYSWTAVVCKR